jgi:hypothetical protein
MNSLTCVTGIGTRYLRHKLFALFHHEIAIRKKSRRVALFAIDAIGNLRCIPAKSETFWGYPVMILAINNQDVAVFATQAYEDNRHGTPDSRGVYR